MSEILDEFQKKYHPCYKCCVRICCTVRCSPFNIYLTSLQNSLDSYFKNIFNYKCQFYIGKFYYIGFSDYKVKEKLLMRNVKTVIRLKSNEAFIKLIIKEMIKRIESNEL